MALENMYVVMLRWFQEKSASSEIIDRYHAAWVKAMQNSGEPLPCPSCFVDGTISRLSPLPDSHGMSAAKCIFCKSKFEWPSPD